MNEEEITEIHAEKIVSKGEKASSSIYHEEPEEEQQKNIRDAVTASVDAILYKTDGDLWRKSIIVEGDFEPKEKIFPYGTHVTLIPDMTSSDQNWGFTLTVSKGLKDPNLGGVMQVRGTTANNGETLVKQINTIYSEISLNQMLHATAGLAIKTLYNNANLKIAE